MVIEYDDTRPEYGEDLFLPMNAVIILTDVAMLRIGNVKKEHEEE